MTARVVFFVPIFPKKAFYVGIQIKNLFAQGYTKSFGYMPDRFVAVCA
jgi:hypothetical protein